MTNAMNVLIQDPKTGKSVQVMEDGQTRPIVYQNPSQADKRQNGTDMCKISSRTLIIFILLFASSLLFNLELIMDCLSRQASLRIESHCDESTVFKFDLQPVTNEAQTQQIAKAIQYTPEQLHLSLGADFTERYVTWSTIKPVDESKLIYSEECELQPRVDAISPGIMSMREVKELDAKWSRVSGRHSRRLYTYRARIQALSLGCRYSYKASSVKDGDTFYSKSYQFSSEDITAPHATVTLALYGDLGLVNGVSIDRLIKDVDNKMYDLIIHNGDFAYDLNSRNAQVGDEFMRKIEPIAARVPYQTSVGNHEIAQNFTHYDHRFTMINSGGLTTGSQNNFYYSFNVGPIHFVAFSTEFYYFLDSVGIEALHNQYEWLKKDLSLASSASERAERPWIIVFGHRPMYCSSRSRDDCSKTNNIIRKGLPFVHTYALEKLFYDFGVDVQFYSHEHQYERFLPLYDGRVLNGTERPDDPYFNPQAPVHLISGSAGCDEKLDPFEGKAATGSVKQISDYGYTRLRASSCQIRFQQISDDQAGDVVDEFVVTKTKQNFPTESSDELFCSPEPDTRFEFNYMEEIEKMFGLPRVIDDLID